MVAAVVGGEQLVGVLGVADYGVEIDDGVEVAGGANPVVDGLAVGFAQGAGVIVVGADVGGDRRAVDAQAVGVGAGDQLLIGGEDASDLGGVVGGRDFGEAGESAEIVDAFEDDDPLHGGGGEDIAIEAGEGVGTEAVGEQVIAADALVGDSDVAGCGRGLQALGEDVGPAVVAVGSGAVAVGDGVAEGDDGGGRGFGAALDREPRRFRRSGTSDRRALASGRLAAVTESPWT